MRTRQATKTPAARRARTPVFNGGVGGRDAHRMLPATIMGMEYYASAIKPESRRGGIRARAGHGSCWRSTGGLPPPCAPPCVPYHEEGARRVPAISGWDKVRAIVGQENKRLLPVHRKKYSVGDTGGAERAGLCCARRNAITGAGFREYDHAALDGVREATDWWRESASAMTGGRQAGACLLSGRRA